ncbi:hypothetical protein ED733_001384 [Metarhizium rileyi]|uniref:Uncharacterized protein n=1 Tax=Metarhizium rileyi (strain RCEF 4871) TaxID=1649241 RepID=A0A5C6G4V9_METRR|nr:hypothetical protein ED733_001384 [Metarhizium rileyi]
MVSNETFTHEEQFQRLQAAIDQNRVSTQSHSFQIVALQNLMQNIHNARIQEAKERRELKKDNEWLRENVAYLKGCIAKLIVDFHSTDAAAATDKMCHRDNTAREAAVKHRKVHSHNMNDYNASWAQRNRVVEITANRLPSEQRSLSVRLLQNSAQMSPSLSDKTRDQLKELDPAPFYDALETMTENGDDITMEEADDSFSLEDGLLQAPASAHGV